MQDANNLEVLSHRIGQHHREHGSSILLPLAVADDDHPRHEVDVFDAETQSFEQPHAGAVEKGDDELRRSAHLGENRPHLVLREHDRKAPRLARSHHILQPRERIVEHMSVQKEQSAQCLCLRRAGNVLARREVSEKGVDLLGSHGGRMTLVVEEDEPSNPAGVGFLGPDAVVPHADGVANTVEQTPGWSRCVHATDHPSAARTRQGIYAGWCPASVGT